MTAIKLSNLKKNFKVFRRSEGFISSFRSLFRRKYDIVSAVDDISFTIEKGELVGFIGPNGAGKTTTLKCLSGLLWPSSGEIDILGFQPFEKKKEYLKKIALIMGQRRELWWDLPAAETFRLNKEIYEVEDNDYEAILAELLTLLDAHEITDVPVRQLSLGQRMKMELIASLIHKPEILFLDEPTIGLDVVMQKKMREFISHYNRKYSATIILTSHYMSDVEKLCKRIIIIDHGKLLYDGSLDTLKNKYANSKIIKIDTDKKISPGKLSKYCHIKSVTDGKIVLSVPKTRTTQIATLLLKKYTIRDLNIEDPEIEDIIASVFAKNNK